MGMTLDRYVDACAQRGIGPHISIEQYHAAFREGLLPKPHTPIPLSASTHEDTPEGVTTKFLTTVPSAARGSITPGSQSLEVESVIIPMLGRSGIPSLTLCVSSQVGCAMGCGFCETAQMGLIRSLTAEEIVAQWFNAQHVLGQDISNLVFMGMGEPMDNLDAVLEAIEILTGHHGPSIPMSKITISTVGRTDGLKRLGERLATPGWKRLRLAISINAPNDTIRSELMPINRAMPMAQLRQTLLDLPMSPSRMLCFEYVLIPGVNDAQEHAQELAEFLSPWAATQDQPRPQGLVNIIPYNPRRDSPWPAPEESSVDEFVGWLSDLGLFVKRRRTKGRSTMAACGQLGAAHIRKRRFVGLSTSAGSNPHPEPSIPRRS